jgi:peptidoglycan/LPS O-acetylase OafA/YrhL
MFLQPASPTLPAAARPEATAPGPAKLFTARLPELDGARGLGILLVLITHYGAHGLHTRPHTAFDLLHNLLTWGWSGVDLFFVLSGFLIGGILIENRESPHYFKTFYVRRVCRIFPIYYLWLLISLAMPLLRLPEHAQHLYQPELPFWSYFTYTQNILSVRLGDFGPEWYGPTWSLAVEEQFYLLFPLFIRFCPPKSLPYALVLLAMSAIAVRAAAYFVLPAPGYAGFVLLPCRWDSLALGALAAWLARRPGFIEALRRQEWFVFGLAGLILATLFFLRAGHHGDLHSLGMHLLGLFLLALLCCEILLTALYSSRRWIKAFFCNRWLRKLGTVSYCTYLIHMPVVFLCHALLRQQDPQIDTLPGLMTTVLAIVVTLSLAMVSWHFFESKCVAWGRKLAY